MFIECVMMCFGYLFCVMSLVNNCLLVLRKFFNEYAFVMVYECRRPIMDPVLIVFGVKLSWWGKLIDLIGNLSVLLYVLVSHMVFFVMCVLLL